MVETRPPVSLPDSMLHMALTGTGPFTTTGCAKCFFTDGSLRTARQDDHDVLYSGSGVAECTLEDGQYCYQAKQADPSKHGPHHDIFRAELVAILLALR
jgi:hypothetical protein